MLNVGTGHRLNHAESSREAFDELRLSRTKVAREEQDVPGLCQSAEQLAQATGGLR